MDRAFLPAVLLVALGYVVYRWRKDVRRCRRAQQTQRELRMLRQAQAARVEQAYAWPDLGDDALNAIFAIADAAPDGIATGLIVDGNVVPIRRTQPPQERG